MATNAQTFFIFVIYFITLQSSWSSDGVCIPLHPPDNGVIRCERIGTQLDERCSRSTKCHPFTTPVMESVLGPYNFVPCIAYGKGLVCTATCNDGFSFGIQEVAVMRICDTDRGFWNDTSALPKCQAACNKYLLYENHLVSDEHFTASSWTRNPGSCFGNGGSALNSAPSSSNGTLLGRGWRPETDDLNQYVQVRLPHVHRIVGIVTKGRQMDEGSTESNYVTLFRVLYSLDGKTFTPYGDEYVYDKFFHGNNDTETPVVSMLSCPFEARYVRINPLQWHGHIGLRFDLIGCDVTGDDGIFTTKYPKTTTSVTEQTNSGSDKEECRPLEPPENGVVNCEKSSSDLICTAVCKDQYQFINGKTIIKHLCDTDTNIWKTGKQYPKCIARPPRTVTPDNPTNRNCVIDQSDCHVFGNGDFSACADCHYFATCSEGYVYFRPCPNNLVFDAGINRCQYRSTSC